jgi:hypothetical protein
MKFIASLIEQISGAGVGRTRSTWCFWYRPLSPRPNPANKISLRFFELARVLVRFDYIAVTDLTHFRIFSRNVEPNFTHYLCEERKENGNL